MSKELLMKKLDTCVELPKYAHTGDAGMDLVAAEPVHLYPGERAVVPCGFAMALPEGTAGFVLPRSGMASKRGITVVNAPGLIDSGYRGEVCVALINHDKCAQNIERGDRIAQLVIMNVETPTIKVVDELDETERGEGGFGSTGTKTA